MKYLYVLLLLLIGSNETLNAQATNGLLANYRINMAVPDLPSFKALNVDASKLLRPSDIKQFSFLTSEFLNDENRMVIPKSLAVEIAPAYLIPSISLAGYRRSAAIRFLANTRFSLASQRTDRKNDLSKLAGGIRFTLINKGDFKLDDTLFHAVQRLENEVENDAKIVYAKQFNIVGPAIGDIDITNKRFVAIRDSLIDVYKRVHADEYAAISYEPGTNNYR
ncbi:MAG TPA: hypothetical protein VM888_13345, partial [Chitinophagaceae bacterium]|nr:hypothetical protein [Chitinophagaceae bacterium]